MEEHEQLSIVIFGTLIVGGLFTFMQDPSIMTFLASLFIIVVGNFMAKRLNEIED